MPRPVSCRRVGARPEFTLFKPAGVRAAALDEVVLTVDEFEALRLGDLEGLHQEHAADEMNVSRQTFGRIINSARRKVALALVEGKAVRIEGGHFETADTRLFRCRDCRHSWELPFGTGRPSECPGCGSGNIRRAPEDRGPRGRGRGRGRGRR